MEQIIDKTKPVLVTGASGYIANWIIKYLLEDGCTVHGTVRNLDNEKSVGPLNKIAESAPQGTLKLFKADLLDEGSFDEAMQGCEVVMHTASPFLVRGFKDPEQALIKPAVEGTRNVLAAVNRTESVKRVVLTSSVAAVFGDNADLKKNPRGIFNEEDWNFSSSVNHQPYSYSKFLAEKEAWKLHDAQSRWHLVTINPSMVGGPALTKYSHSTSIDTLRGLGNGRLWPGVPNMRLGWVDVRDVVQGAIAAEQRGRSGQRYLLTGQWRSVENLADIVTHLSGSVRPRFVAPLWLAMMGAPFVTLWSRLLKIRPRYTTESLHVLKNHRFVSHQKATEELDYQPRPIRETIKDTIEWFRLLIVRKEQSY